MREFITDLFDAVTPGDVGSVTISGSIAVLIQYTNVLIGFCIGLLTLAFMGYRAFTSKINKKKAEVDLEMSIIELEDLRARRKGDKK